VSSFSGKIKVKSTSTDLLPDESSQAEFAIKPIKTSNAASVSYSYDTTIPRTHLPQRSDEMRCGKKLIAQDNGDTEYFS